MSENSTLRIHTQFTPQDPGAPTGGKDGRRRHRWTRPGRGTPGAAGARSGFGDRLLRNSAIACAALLGVLALGNTRQPWAEKAVEGIERALSMHIDLDDSIGELTFVRQLMPESALVFLNVSGGSELSLPAEGALSHAWSQLQPWLMLESGDSPVFAVTAGTVTAVSPLSNGRRGVLIDHGNGLESLYAGLEDTLVQAGDSVGRGQQLGNGSDELYFELRQDGEPIDPTERLGL